LYRIFEYFSGKTDLTKIVYNDWTKKDVLAHIASWLPNTQAGIMRNPAPYAKSLALKTRSIVAVAEMGEAVLASGRYGACLITAQILRYFNVRIP